jgi:plastocyanin
LKQYVGGIMKIYILVIVILTFFVRFTTFGGDIAGKIKAKGAPNAANTVVFINKIEGKTFKPPSKPLLMDQKDLTFYPHVLPLLVGTKVDFLNSDNVLHNVFSPDECTGKFNLGSWPKGEKKSFTFDKPCVSVMLCNVHPEMEAWVLAVETPYFTVTDTNGYYIIKNVPAGTYTLRVWNEKLKADNVKVVVPKEGKVTQDFLITK